MATAILSPKSVAQIKHNEGFRSDIYLDTVGKQTTGYGFNVKDPMMAKFIPQDVVGGKRQLSKVEADDILINKVLPVVTSDARNFVGKGVFDKLDPVRKQVLVDMSYNLGGPNLNKFVKLQSAVQKGDYVRAAQEILNTPYAKQVPQRAQANARAILTGMGK